MKPIGYVVMQHSVRRVRPVKSYEKWIARIPDTYRRYVLDTATRETRSVQHDPNPLALLKHFRSLMPMAQESKKPVFHLKAADGAIAPIPTPSRTHTTISGHWHSRFSVERTFIVAHNRCEQFWKAFAATGFSIPIRNPQSKRNAYDHGSHAQTEGRPLAPLPPTPRFVFTTR